VRRRRACIACGARFTTTERVQSHSLFVVKKDGRSEEYDREKLAAGIRKACEKRPLPTGSIEKLVSSIEAQLHALGRAEVSSAVVGDLVMEGLKKLDHIAYIRFASVYREFADIGALKDALDSLTSSARTETGPSVTSADSQPVQNRRIT